MSAEPWYTVGPHDVFPEEFGTFLLGDPRVRSIFMNHHGDLLEAEFWQRKQEAVRAGRFDDVFPYPESVRFRNRYDEDESAPGAVVPGPSTADPAAAPAGPPQPAH
jgi:isocitrate dehydrogenase kinase/phosphatase